MTRLGERHSRARGSAAVGMVGTITIHAVVAGVLLFGVKPPKAYPPVYAVQLVAAPAPTENAKPAPDVVQRPAEETPAPVKTTPKPSPAPPAQTVPRPPEQREPVPRSRPSQERPAPGESPSTGNDVANIKTPGLEFPYPDYLRNIVTQVFRRWDRPLGPAVLRAEVSFLILKDGSVRDIRFVTPSGNFSFDLSCQGAIEAAGNGHAFGPLPDEYEADVLPVSFFFSPRTQP